MAPADAGKPTGLGPFTATAEGLRLAVLAQPRARRAELAGLVEGPDGPRLKVRVTAPPEDGKANAAIVALLAKAWRLPKSAIRLELGAGDRRKVFLLAGDPQSLAREARGWLGALNEKRTP